MRNKVNVANLKPIKPREVRNPTGKNQFSNPLRPVSDAIRELVGQPLPEVLRCAMNAQIRKQLGKQNVPDFYPEGISWAAANAVRLGLLAVVKGNLGASIEIREAIESRAQMRVEISSRADKLDALLEAFQKLPTWRTKRPARRPSR